MDFFSSLLSTIIFILFPLLLYVIYAAYRNNLNKGELKLVFGLSLLTSFYLIIKFGDVNNISYLLFINIPLIISYLKRRPNLSIILSLLIVLYYYFEFDFNIYIISLEYVFYYCFYYHIIRKRVTSDLVINTFTFFKGVIISLEVYLIATIRYPNINTFVHVFIALIIFYLLSIGILSLLEKGEEIINLNNVLKELENEKALRTSLFKITHEVKNPISVCKGYLKMMDYNDINKVRKYNDIIEKEINRTLVIMDDFLDYTKIKIVPEVMDVCMLVEDVLSSMDSMFDANSIELDYDIPENEVYIYGDYERLKQALVNIIKNAIEACTKNGTIIITCEQKKNKFVVIIKDNGIGMDQETLNKISDLFFTTKTKGTGLGVNLTKEIIELHNGTIKYHSEVNKGTEVIIKLPIKKLSLT